MENKNRRVSWTVIGQFTHTPGRPLLPISLLEPGSPLPMDGESLNLLGRLNETSSLRESALRRETLSARFHVRDPPLQHNLGSTQR